MNSSRLHLAFAYFVLLLGVAFLLSSIAAWLRFKVQIPVRDIILLLPLVESGIHQGWSSIPLQDWIEPISGNTHRIFITRVLMLFDYAFLGGQNYAIYLSAWLSILIMVFSYFKAADLQFSQNRAGRCFVVGLSLIYLCSPTQLLNLLNPISASWFVAFACGAASVLIILSAGKKLNFWLMLLVCLLAAIAAFSNFVGVVACMLLPVVALHQRSRLSVAVAFFSIVLVFFYFHGVEPARSAAAQAQATMTNEGAGTAAIKRLVTRLESPTQRVKLFKNVTRSVGLHLGAPLSADYPMVASLAVLGSVLFMGGLWLALLARWCTARDPSPRSEEYCLAMATICFGVACAITVARNMHAPPLAERYQTITMIYWLSISCLIFLKAQDLDDKRRCKSALYLLACIPALPVFGAFSSNTELVAKLSNSADVRQILGQMGIKRYAPGENSWINDFDRLIENHEKFLSAYGFKPLDTNELELRKIHVDQSRCEGFWLDMADSDWPGVQTVRLMPAGISRNPFVNRMNLRGNNHEWGRLYVEVPRNSNLRSIFFDRRTWRGYYRGEVAVSLPITLYVDPVIGRRYQCTLTVHRT